MLSTLKKGRSLTFYQQTSLPRRNISTSYAGGISSAAIANTSLITSNITNGFNSQLNGLLNLLNSSRVNDAGTLNLSTPNHTARNRGVYRAWQYEKADILMGGDGSKKWSNSQKQEIVDNVDLNNQSNSRSGVKGQQGHHQKNVSDHPEHQANPDNIKFYDKDEHLNAHDGNWDNKTDGPMIDKNQMLKNTNFKRVFKNELKGLGLAVAIGVGVGATIGFIVTLAQSGVTPDTIKQAAIVGAKSGVESGALASIGYGIGRTIGDFASKAMLNVIVNKFGVNITENLIKMVSMGGVGFLTISVFTAYQFIKMKINGTLSKDSLIQVGKQTMFSLSLLSVSIIAQGVYGGSAGIIVSLSIGIIFISYTAAKLVHDRSLSDKIREYMIDKCCPIFEV